MKKILIGICIMAIAFSGCSCLSQPKENADQGVSSLETSASRFQYTEPLSLNEVKTALIFAGLPLIDDQKEVPTDYQIGTVTPAVYSTSPNNQLLVYIFNSIADRKAVCWSGGLFDTPATRVPIKENHFTRSYTVKNVLIINLLNVNIMQINPTANQQILKFLPRIALCLNDSQKAVFTDKGTNWDARYIVDYYQHWYKDDKGITQLDQFSNAKWVVKYIGPDPESIHNLRYEYKTPGTGGSGDGIYVKSGEDYYLKIGGEYGGNNIPDKDTVCTLTIQWNGREESLNLAISESGL